MEICVGTKSYERGVGIVREILEMVMFLGEGVS